MASVIVAALLESAFSIVIERSAGLGIGRLRRRLRNAAEKKELAQIGANAIESAAIVAPSLAGDLRSDSFSERCLAPAMLEVIANPLGLADAQALADAFIAMFVERFAGAGSSDAALEGIFQTNRATLQQSMEALFTEFRNGLSRSKHWRDIAQMQLGADQLQVSMEILAGVNLLVGRQAQSLANINLEDALADVARGSEDLKSWPRDIWGSQILRPEFDALHGQLKQNPRSTILLVGEAGSGKSALLSSLTERLNHDGLSVLGIKADRLPADVRNIDDIAVALGMQGPIIVELRALAALKPVVMIIDQLDAVSDVMDRSSARMRLLLQLVTEARKGDEDELPIAIVVSSRPFEAEHDARFRRLGAQEMKLALPGDTDVGALLAKLGIDSETVPEAMRQTIRRPFALKLFVDLVKRGVRLDGLLPGQLLQRWLDTIRVNDDRRRGIVALMTDLAEEMVRTETLWRPADRFELQHGPELRDAEACGLIARESGRIGFSHQNWLDDFQARSFVTGRDLCDFAWRVQDSLFPRAAVLRGLQRLRQFDSPAYVQAIDHLLGDPRTRRHLRHLSVDMIALADDPLPREIAWVRRLIENDTPLAKRAISRILQRWQGWRAAALQWVPLLQKHAEFEWHLTRILVAESAYDLPRVAKFLNNDWAAAEHDQWATMVIEQSARWQPDFAIRMTEAAQRRALSPYGLSSVAKRLTDQGDGEQAARLVEVFVRHSSEDLAQLQIHDLEKFVEVDPVVFARILVPWFVELCTSDIEPENSYRDRFPESRALGWHWNYDDVGGNIFSAFRLTLRLTGERNPEALLEILKPHFDREIEEVQTIIAHGLTSAGKPLANVSLEWLLGDSRRFQVGDAHATATDGVGRTLYGWSAQQLIRTIVPHLSDGDLVRLKSVILGWSLYAPADWSNFTAGERKVRLPGIQEARFALLEPLPTEIIGMRTRRQIDEWRVEQPVFERPMNRIGMAQMVGSPMSSASMEKASDPQILQMLEEVNDTNGSRFSERSWRRSYMGGVSELANAFGGFAKAHPDRALKLLPQLKAGRHEYAAGSAIREIAAEADPDTIVKLILLMDSSGFSSRSWRNDCAWAFQTIAGRMKGLGDEDVALLDRWIRRDSTAIIKEMAARREMDKRNEENNKHHKREGPQPMLFRQIGVGGVIPQGNYTFLEAIGRGLLLRDPPEHQRWIEQLRRHIEEPEDPLIWAHLLASWGHSLFWVASDVAARFWRSLAIQQPECFDEPLALSAIWHRRHTMPLEVRDRVLGRWLGMESQFPQMAGELVGGIYAADAQDPTAGNFVTDIQRRGGSALVGLMFSLAAAWRVDDPGFRARTHPLLLEGASSDDEQLLTAVSSALSQSAELPADSLTVEMLDAFAVNSALLAKSDGYSFSSNLQHLLLFPGFDEPVLRVAQALAELTLNDQPAARRRADSQLVQLSVALQRNDGPLRAGAMDLYERLLDAAVYGAEEAAEAATRD